MSDETAHRAFSQARPTRLAEREPDLPSGPELVLSPAELVAEHTGRIEWAKRDEWVGKLPQDGSLYGPTTTLVQLAAVADELANTRVSRTAGIRLAETIRQALGIAS